MRTEIMNISPDVAKHMLLSNTMNRAIRPRKWKKYSEEMKSGYWKLSHQGIAFSSSGKLLDGQHRLLAVIDSGLTIPFMVSYGLDESLFGKIDVGFLRTTSEITKIPSKQLSVVKFLATYAFKQEIAVQTETLAAIHKAFLGEFEMLEMYCTSNRKVITSAPVRAAAILEAYESGIGRPFDIYRDMCLMHFDQLPPVALSFLKQVASESVVSGGASGADRQAVTFVKACDVFDVKSQNLKVLKIGDDKKSAAFERLHRIVVKAADEVSV